MVRPIRDRAAYYRAVDRNQRPHYPAQPAPAPAAPPEPEPEPEPVSITWLLTTLEHLAAHPAIVQNNDHWRALAEARKLVAQHVPANLANLVKLPLGDASIRALVEKAGMKVKSPKDVEKVRRLLRVALESVRG